MREKVRHNINHNIRLEWVLGLADFVATWFQLECKVTHDGSHNKNFVYALSGQVLEGVKEECDIRVLTH